MLLDFLNLQNYIKGLKIYLAMVIKVLDCLTNILFKFPKDYWANAVDHLIHNIPEGLKDCIAKICISKMKNSP